MNLTEKEWMMMEKKGHQFDADREAKKEYREIKNVDVLLIDKAGSVVKSEEWEEYEVQIKFLAKRVHRGVDVRGLTIIGKQK